jgi:HEAT repeat protein
VRLNTGIAFRDIQPVSRAAIPVLIQCLNSRDGDAEWFSVQALGNIGAEAAAAVPALKLRLKREVVERVEAAWALWQIEHNAAEVLPIFEEALDRKHRVPWLVMRYLAPMGSAAGHAVPLIEAVAEEEREYHPRVRSQALQALAQISTNTVPFLVKHLKNRDPGIRVSAAVALGNIGPTAAASVASLEALLQDQRGRIFIHRGKASVQ